MDKITIRIRSSEPPAWENPPVYAILRSAVVQLILGMLGDAHIGMGQRQISPKVGEYPNTGETFSVHELCILTILFDPQAQIYIYIYVHIN